MGGKKCNVLHCFLVSFSMQINGAQCPSAVFCLSSRPCDLLVVYISLSLTLVLEGNMCFSRVYKQAWFSFASSTQQAPAGSIINMHKTAPRCGRRLSYFNLHPQNIAPQCASTKLICKRMCRSRKVVRVTQ